MFVVRRCQNQTRRTPSCRIFLFLKNLAHSQPNLHQHTPTHISTRTHVYIVHASFQLTYCSLEWFLCLHRTALLDSNPWIIGHVSAVMNLDNVLRQVLVGKCIPYQLKSQQQDILRHLVDKSNVLAVLPTGYGKSVLYALLPAVMDKVSYLFTLIYACISSDYIRQIRMYVCYVFILKDPPYGNR